MNTAKNTFQSFGLIEAIAVPHPPLIIPSVGKGEEVAIRSTIDAYQMAASSVVAAHPNLIILTSPHAPLFRDGFFVCDADKIYGDMSRFGAPQTKLAYPGDPTFAEQLATLLEQQGIPIAKENQLSDRFFFNNPQGEIDHGSFVPLYFLSEAGLDVPIVIVGLSGLDSKTHEQAGRTIVHAAIEQKKRLVLVASGDLSHKLKEDGPYGFDPAGPLFDDQIKHIFTESTLSELFQLDEQLCENAAECGLKSFQIMTGALEEQASIAGSTISSELLSCEGPFGVGYAVAIFQPSGKFTEQYEEDDTESKEDLYIKLARESVEGFVRTGKPIKQPDDLPNELLTTRAGVFVSLHKGNDLRGCIGTISATRDCIADEIIANGIAACSQDPRFNPVRVDELPYLHYSVDVLSEAEPIDSPEALNPKRYGVIVTKGWKRGLLLPNLDGVDTVAQQLAVAKQKARISINDNDVTLERFEVVRHE